MNFKVAFRLAHVLSLSSVRARRTRGGEPSGLAQRPIANLYASAVALPAAAVLSYLLGPGLLGDRLLVKTTSVQLLIMIPFLALSLSLLYSLLFEFSESSQAASTDLLNWLPVAPADYVLGSAICTSYFISPMVSLAVGVSLGLALCTGAAMAWVVSTMLALVGIVIGTSISEIARALLNRASATLYRRAGRSALAARMILGVIMIVALAAIFNINFFVRLLEWFVGRAIDAWFVPILWPSMAVAASLQANLDQALAYFALSLSLTLLVFGLAVLTRAVYWVPVTIAPRLGALGTRKAGRSLLRRLGFAPAEAALIRKDLRSLTRRREMMMWIAIPAVLFMMPLLNLGADLPGYASGSLASRLASLAPMGVGALFLGFYLSLVSFGQEGEAFINIIGSPLEPRQVARAKLAASFLPASIVLAIVLVVVSVAVRPRWEIILAISGVALTTLIESTLIGSAFGARYPDFTEVPRARFIRRSGAYLGMFTAAAVAAATALPLSLHISSGSLSLAFATSLSLLASGVISFGAYEAMSSGVTRLCAQVDL